MSENLHYWYKGFGASSPSYELPPQAISTKKKNKEWERCNMDALERIGIKQIHENIRFKDYYRMVDGKHSYSELAQVMPQLREVGEMLDDMEIPSHIKHYDLIGIIINALVGEYLQNSDKYYIHTDDEISTNEYLRDKSEKLISYVKEQFDKELTRKLIERGFDLEVNGKQFKTEEQKQAYLQQLEQVKRQLTPPQIEKYMRTEWRTMIAIWGDNTLEFDKERYRLDEKDRQELIDFLLTGRCFRHYRIGYDSYEPETWSPINTFFSQDLETKYVEDGDYVGRVHFYTPNQVINKYGHLLSKKQKESILQSGNVQEHYTAGTYSAEKVLKKHFGETHITPFRNYHDYNFMLDIQDEFGVPMGERTYLDKDEKQTTVPVFMPNHHSDNLGVNNLASKMRDDLNLRSDLLRVTEAYWRGYQKVGYINYATPNGNLTSEIVTDEILPEFLREHGIKSITTKSLVEMKENPQPNTITWDYQPVVYKGVKVSSVNACLDEDIYLDIGKMELQLKGNSGTYDTKLPVCGLVDKSLAKKIENWQLLYNVVSNQKYNLLEKEIGLFFIFDINFLPSEFKEWGDTEENLIHLRNLTKDLGLLPIDASRQNLNGGGGFNQFSLQNLSYSSQLADRIQLAEYFKSKAFEQVGLTQQRLGNPIKYETAEGVKVSQDASYAQTEMIFSKFSDYKRNALEMHLNVAQYSQKSGKDITLFYARSYKDQAFVKFTDPNFKFRDLRMLPISNAKKRKDLEEFKAYLKMNNTMGGDELALAELFTSDTMVELIEVARSIRLKNEQNVEQQRQHDIQLAQQTAQNAKDNLDYEWKLREDYAQNRDATKIEVEKIDALGRAADNNADVTSLNFIIDQANLSLKRNEQNHQQELQNRVQDREDEKHNFDMDFKMKKLNADMEKTRAILEKSKNDKYIAEINK